MGSAYTADVRTHLIIKLPFIYKNTGFRRKGLFLDHSKLRLYLNLSDESLSRLTTIFNGDKFKIPTKASRLDKVALALEYKKMIEEGKYKNKADLARSLNVSRVWITKVMNKLK